MDHRVFHLINHIRTMADQSEASSSKLPTSSRLTDAAGLDGFSDDDDQGVGFGLDDLLPVRDMCLAGFWYAVRRRPSTVGTSGNERDEIGTR